MGSSTSLLALHDDNLHVGSAKRNTASGVKGIDASLNLTPALVMADIDVAVLNAANGLPQLNAASKVAVANLPLANASTAYLNGTHAGGAWTALDLSGVVGTRIVLAIFRVLLSTGTNQELNIRQSGGTEQPTMGGINWSHMMPGLGVGDVACLTNASGVIDYYASIANRFTLTLTGWIALS